jgi:polar amino acid transport system ATP-binding protein
LIVSLRRPRFPRAETTSSDGTIPALRVRGLEKRYGDVEVLRGIDLDAERGEFLALLGPSGCGKTTTLRVIAGFERPHAGSIEIGGGRVCDAAAAGGRWVPPEARRIGMVFQDYALFPHLSVARNVAFGLPRNAANREARVASALATVGLAGLGERTPDQLSGGQQQRVAIARALALKPEILLLDEVTAALDPELVSEVLDSIRLLAREGMTMLIVSHEMGFIREVSSRVAFLAGGRILEIGAPASIFDSPREARTREFVSKILRH